ncbi:MULTISPECIES: hypothetical protein [Chryseobacterium]|uniref:Anti-sigma factor n=1 Tax=Chryseobacterium camelliae TaxID=1265445 RepID=A0ABU0TLY0_9FLAO|nr:MULTISPECIES: hypothetical protein [Chryseobacterium]MDT3408095.1 hypothetical protein [Pseudacidovorax intermedius]MDQ1098049.1 hypothetical protein [Chryseobacterium camelliae]MDQ1101980.1 hypothetical protein [Chryseobacterium sp. SORGH_AS_1048]MDR6085417.1 hypothetical protein [Chryseobacterium sp. SORGH_AS_0909]MDR6129780.1 hypothetical protein [Chryseobacterium sp. SORGH_AS_1175]
MNLSKHNLEQQIKKQMDEREINPSRDLWAEIQAHQPATQSSGNAKWIFAAACCILVAAMGAVLFMMRDDNSQKAQPVEKVYTVHKEKESKEPAVSYGTAEQHKISSQKIAEHIPSKGPTVQHSQTEILPQKEAMPLTAVHLAPEEKIESKVYAVEIPASKAFAAADSSKVPVYKKRYTDAGTLLFSVEHKDAIEKTKGVSNVAKVDLNAR